MKPVIKWNGHFWIFECPACGCLHFADERWKLTGDEYRPSFTPSIFVPHRRCHFYIIDGVFIFLSDCHHDFAGKSVPMSEIL